MTTIQGITLNPGFVIGNAKVITQKQYNIKSKSIKELQISDEIICLEQALSKAEKDIIAILESSNLANQDKDIIETHLLILRDPDIVDSITSKITDNLHSAAHAVHQTFEQIIKQFEELQNDFFAQRVGDYKDVAHRLLGAILGEGADDAPEANANDIIVIKEMNPSHVTSIARKGFKAYVSEKGSYNSHSSILSRALDLVAVTSLPGLMESVRNQCRIIVDGINSLVIVDPDENTISHYQELMQKYQVQNENLKKLKFLPSLTLDNREIKLSINLELPQELDTISDLGCDGIGLFRTEFIYLSQSQLPSEQEQTRIYQEVVQKIAPQIVTFRTFDLGGDKMSHLLHFSKEENPYLGCRGIRFSLAQRNLFKTQLRAILKASAFGKAKIMFPMVIDTEDFLSAKDLCTQCMRELDSEGVTYDSDIQLGVMIEIPSAALCSEGLAQIVDFFSIGTNDLVQYTLAVDRNNDIISSYYTQHHPAVLSLIQLTIQSAKKYNTPVSICGEMASIDEYIPLLIGMGITELSVNPGSYYNTKAIIRKCDKALRERVGKWDFLCSVQDVEALIYKDLKQYYQK